MNAGHQIQIKLDNTEPNAFEPVTESRMRVWGRIIDTINDRILSDWVEIPALAIAFDCSAGNAATVKLTARVHQLHSLTGLLDEVDLAPLHPSEVEM